MLGPKLTVCQYVIPKELYACGIRPASYYSRSPYVQFMLIAAALLGGLFTSSASTDSTWYSGLHLQALIRIHDFRVPVVQISLFLYLSLGTTGS